MKNFLRPFGAPFPSAPCDVLRALRPVVVGLGLDVDLLPCFGRSRPGSDFGKGRKIIKIFIRLVKLRSSRLSVWPGWREWGSG